MTDSLFSGRNHYDEQVERFDLVGITLLMEASTRRLSTLKGPLYAAGRIQRLADICAGVYVMPIEHWKTTPEKPVSAEPAKPKHWLRRLAGRIYWSYWIGLAVGILIGLRWQ